MRRRCFPSNLPVRRALARPVSMESGTSRPPTDHQCADRARDQQAEVLRDGEGYDRGEADHRPQRRDHQQPERESRVGPQKEPQGEERRRTGRAEGRRRRVEVAIQCPDQRIQYQRVHHERGADHTEAVGADREGWWRPAKADGQEERRLHEEKGAEHPRRRVDPGEETPVVAQPHQAQWTASITNTHRPDPRRRSAEARSPACRKGRARAGASFAPRRTHQPSDGGARSVSRCRR